MIGRKFSAREGGWAGTGTTLHGYRRDSGVTMITIDGLPAGGAWLCDGHWVASCTDGYGLARYSHAALAEWAASTVALRRAREWDEEAALLAQKRAEAATLLTAEHRPD